MKFSNDIIGKVISQYLGAKVDVSTTEWYKEERKLRGRFIEATLAGLNLHEDSKRACISHNIKTQSNGMQWLDFSVFKLILKSLSSITDEDAIEVAKILFGKEYSEGRVNRNTDYEVSVCVLKPNTTINQNVRIGFDGGLSNCNGYGLRNMLEAYQYLISKNYDMPQHLLDGKTLFEAGLSLRPLSELEHKHVLEIAEFLGYNQFSEGMNKEFIFKESKTLGNIEEEISKRGYEIQSLHKLKQKQTA